ncbi:MAG: cytochrome P450 [Chloroflexi bacterium]|nr:cytochrome P450 [Chloroflexota bacterium]
MRSPAIKPSWPVSHHQTPPSIGKFPLGILAEYQRDPLKLYMRAMLEYRDLVRMRFGPSYSYVVFHPDYVQHILVDNRKNFQRNKLRNGLFKVVTGENLFTSDGDFWLRQRRLLQPAFHRQRIFGFGQLITNCAAQMLAAWDQYPSGARLDVDQEMMRVTLRTVGLALFSTDLTANSSEIGHVITKSSAYFTYRLTHLLAPPLWVPTPRNREFKRLQASVGHRVPELIATRKRLIAEQGDAENAGRPVDMIDLLLNTRYEDTGEAMDDEQMGREIRIFIGAGHETTSNTLSWTLYLLSQHPEVEAKLQAEVDQVLAQRTPTMEDISQLPYMRKVLEESMRLYPAAWAISRQSINEDQLGPYYLPADASVILPIYAVHHHSDFWENPEQFDPERFAPERAAQQHRFAYFPFGGGPRQCIGNTFAMTEAHLILAMIVQRYKLRLQPGIKIEPMPLITLRIKGGLPMTLERR